MSVQRPTAPAPVQGSTAAGVQYSEVLVRRVQPASVAPGSFQLVPKPPGSLGSLVPVPVPEPGSGEVEGQACIRVRAVGLNFRDLLMVSNEFGLQGVISALQRSASPVLFC